MSSEYSELSLASKFGCDLTEAPELLQTARQHADWLGVCFHVGSQAMTPFAYVQALERVRVAIGEASVVIDMIDVGGGFPSVYPGMEPPPLEDYFQIIHQNFYNLPIAYNAELWCEPGRALCAEYSSLIVKVEKRRGEELYINDGAYGALFDAAHVDWKFPVRALEDDLIKPEMDFAFYGPTCDDADYMQGPLRLAGGHPGRRLHRDRHARRLRRGDEDRFQRLRRCDAHRGRGRADGQPLRRQPPAPGRGQCGEPALIPAFYRSVALR